MTAQPNRHIEPVKRRTVRYSYLPQQFADPSAILEALKKFIPTGDFTLGKPLEEFEARFAQLIGTRYAIGVGSGTDAIKLPLKAVGVGHGDEVITAANTFIATVGAIAELGAKPVFIDCDDTFCMNPDLLAAAITPWTRAIVPVHFTGYPAAMDKIMAIAERYNLPVIEDACQGILAAHQGRTVGTWGVAGAYSLHPLKNLNVWGDGGVVVTNDPQMAKQLRLLRNHGMRNRDEIEILGYNSRLDTLQAVVGNHLIGAVPEITEARIANAAIYDAAFAKIPQLQVPPRPDYQKRVYHLYIVFAERRDELYRYCQDQGIECKVHYPIPLYLQDALQYLGHSVGDFPVTDRHARDIITFPVDQHLTREDLDYVIDCVYRFYGVS
jgi:dTDP-4-amino-4,6-dideoxygalactose transaminase